MVAPPYNLMIQNFYPRSPCGERRRPLKRYLSMSLFLSTLSLRRATPSTSKPKPGKVISIHALLAESDHWKMKNPNPEMISIHALLAESDLATWQSYHVRGNFYPRSPCGERLPVSELRVTSNVHFYPRSPCGERQQYAI